MTKFISGVSPDTICSGPHSDLWPFLKFIVDITVISAPTERLLGATREERSAFFIAHEIGELSKGARDLNSCQPVLDDFFQRAVHAQQPLIAFGFANREG
jgi:hypothetical protein